jgi:hypothetical protein
VFLTATITVAIFFGCLALSDIFLSDPQKKWIEDRILRLWLWLAEAKQYSILDWLRQYYRWIVGIAVLLVSSYVSWIVWSTITTNFDNHKTLRSAIDTALFGAAISALGLWYGFNIVRATLRSRSLLSATLRATIFVVIALLPLVIIGAIAPRFAQSILPSLLTSQPKPGIAIAQLLTIVVLIASVHFTAISLIFWATVAGPLLLVNALTILLLISEFLIRRIAEYPKGPILAASAIVGVIAAIIKAFR